MHDRGRCRSLEALALALGVVAPRDTIERIVATNPKHQVLLLAALSGMSTILAEWIYEVSPPNCSIGAC